MLRTAPWLKNFGKNGKVSTVKILSLHLLERQENPLMDL